MTIEHYSAAGKAAIMGILNVTPDSFSDGGSYTSVDQALAQAEKCYQKERLSLILEASQHDRASNLCRQKKRLHVLFQS